MIWLEVVSVRTALSIDTARVLEICRQCGQSDATGELLRSIVYCSARYQTDISVHLHWKSDPGPGSILGREVISALKEFGLINHSLWIKQQEFITGIQSKTTLSNTTSKMDTLRR